MKSFQVALTEAQFQKQVTDLAELHGWAWMHIVRCPTNRGDSWRTAAIGPLGKGWPDLVLVRTGSVLFVELKAEKGKLTPDQATVLALLPGLTYVWRPSDWAIIEQVLKRMTDG